VVPVELLAAEGAVAGDPDDHTYGLLNYFCLSGMLLFCSVIAMAFLCRWYRRFIWETVGLYICDLTRALYMNEIYIQRSERMGLFIEVVTIHPMMLWVKRLHSRVLAVPCGVAGVDSGRGEQPSIHQRGRTSITFTSNERQYQYLVNGTLSSNRYI
jgi:hypothetical protein